MAGKRRLTVVTPSLSKSALLLSPCIAWTHPTAEQYDDRFTDTTKRDRGTTFHNESHAIIGGADRYTILRKYDNDVEMQNWLHSAINFLDQVLGPRCESIMSEVAIAIHWESGKVVLLPEVADRKYPEEYRKDGWQCGTADLVCILKDGSLLIADWKTGGTDGATEQLLSLAWGFQWAMPAINEPNHFALRKVKIACLKVFETGIVPDERDVSDPELGLHRDAMLFKIQDVGKEYKPVHGIHCITLYCSHLAFCKAVTGIVEGAAEGPQSLLPAEALVRKYRMTDKPESQDEAGYVMARVTAAKRQLDYYSNAMKEYADRGGKVVCGPYEWSKGKDGFRWRKV
jgi:hypothetical protein